MRDKVIKGMLLSVSALLFGILLTGIVYRFFPQYLCYTVYDVSEGSLYQTKEMEIQPGMSLTEYFVPRNKYLMGISVGVVREDNGNVVAERLLDDQGKLLKEYRFALSDPSYEFPFQKWVEPGRQYRLEILFPEENQSAVTIVSGPGDAGAAEHVASYMDGVSMDQTLVTGYIYGAYSRKLLAFWFIVFFLGGFMIGETVLYKLKLKRKYEAEAKIVP